MTSPEAFNEQELFALLESEEARGSKELESDHQYEVIHERLWTAIETLEIDTWCGPNPADYEREYDLLVEVLLTGAESDQTEEDRLFTEKYAQARARDIWDQDQRAIATIALALEAQLFPEADTAPADTIKKTLMATLIAKGDDAERWFPLVDYVLEGDALDPTNSDDLDIMTRALEMEANANATPQAKLYDTLLSVLGVPDVGTAIDDPLEFQRLDHLTLVARDLVEVTYYLPGEEEQPNRHEKLHQLLREYGVTDESAIKTIFELTDSFIRTE